MLNFPKIDPDNPENYSRKDIAGLMNGISDSIDNTGKICDALQEDFKIERDHIKVLLYQTLINQMIMQASIFTLLQRVLTEKNTFNEE